MIKVVYPKIPRAYRRNCKLSDKEIAEMRKLYGKGATQTELVKMFGVCQYTIWYWCKAERREHNKRRVLYPYAKKTPYYIEERAIRKLLYPEELKAWDRGNNKKYRHCK